VEHDAGLCKRLEGGRGEGATFLVLQKRGEGKKKGRGGEGDQNNLLLYSMEERHEGIV